MSSTSFSLEEENKKTSVMEKANPSQGAIHNDQLAKSLKEMLKKSVKEFKTAYETYKKRKALEGNDEMSSKKVFSSIQRHEDADLLVQDHQKKGRKVKNEVIDEKVVSFSLPRNFDVSSASVEDINRVQERLGTWRIQRRKRDTEMIDMFYCHLSSRQTFRSIPEAVSFIMYESHPRFSKQTPKKHKVGSKTLIESIHDEPRNKVENPQGLDHVEVVKVLEDKEKEGYNNNFSDTFGLMEYFPELTVQGGGDNERTMVVDNATENIELIRDMMNDHLRELGHVEVAKIVEEKENERFNNIGEAEIHQEMMQEGRGRKNKGLIKQSEFESVQKVLNNFEEQRQYKGQFYPELNNLSMSWEEDEKIFSKMIYTDNFDISSYLLPLDFLFDIDNLKK